MVMSRRSGRKLKYYIRKCCFYRSLFDNFLRAGDRWEVILTFKSAAPCRCMLKPSDSQLGGKNMKALY